MIRLDEIDQHKLDKKDVMLIIDRIVVKEEFYNRLADAVQTAFYEGKVSVIYKN
jgi:excinuclease ABC subunit A